MIGTAMAMLVAGLAAGGAQVVGAKMASGAAKRAGDVQASAADKALAFEQQQYDRDYANRQGLRTAMQGERAALSGMRPPTAQAPRPIPPMPPGWKPGDPVGPPRQAAPRQQPSLAGFRPTPMRPPMPPATDDPRRAGVAAFRTGAY